MSYYNTTQEDDSVASTYFIKNKRQEDIILGYMQTAKRLTSSEAHMISEEEGYNWLLTSVRRAMDTLCEEKYIMRDGKKKGPRGRNEFIWQLREEE